jgi:hypothetical protein
MNDFFYYDKFNGHPFVEEQADEDKEFAERSCLFVKPFLKFASTVWRES